MFNKALSGAILALAYSSNAMKLHGGTVEAGKDIGGGHATADRYIGAVKEAGPAIDEMATELEDALRPILTSGLTTDNQHRA